ncbi:hypothetical protein CNMCM5793_003310 [Aspergillus hiratsukae]|uniref:Fungal N-terminal domain-containing protein n=1 Tax=Aspergillus hiratsukae TaxID=1194566 RepID=A0A8H6PDP2_9EURO|nr:hypothetical protein CNMCM5793_003310 [Aspergillus hiratsukae]KAF7169825.1 hypothetical protein CNMCM6106_004728 [Aspergillus hiratsukae]
MSEPFSAVASAAGIISLGIQVTERIVLYCVAWKGYNKDIEDLNHKASGLSKTLKHLENVLQRQQNLDSSSQKQIEDLMDVSKITFDKLKEMTDKIPCPSTDSKAAFAKRALYPLRKQALVDAAGMLDSLQTSISTRLNVLQVAPSLLQSMQDENRHTMAALRCSSAYTVGRRRAAPEQSQVLEKKFRVQSRLLRFSLTLTLSITTGAGGCSIAPALIYRGITGQDFRDLIEDYFRDTPFLERDYVQCSRYLFEKRIIRPFDRTRGGTTLLEAALSSMTFSMRVKRCFEWEELLDPLRNVTRYLLEAGVPVDTSEDTLLNFVLRYWEVKNWSHPAISNLIDAGSYITDDALTSFNRKSIQYFISYHPEAVYLSSPARALVQENEETFARIVRQDQLSGNDTIGFYKAIDLAIGWPSGVKTLLEAGTVSIRENALINAAELGCISSLKLLLEAGSALTKLNVEWIATTPKVYETLRDEGVDVPRRLCPSWYPQGPDGIIQFEVVHFSVFHFKNLPVQYMHRLYNAGLTDVDEPDSDGFTPLKSNWIPFLWEAQSPAQVFGRARWLVSKGADSSRPLPGTGVPALHTVINTGILSSAWKISEMQSEASVNEPFADLDQHDLLFLRNAILENKPDACKCNCSRNGCTPLSISLKNLIRSGWQKYSNPIVLTTSELLHLLPPSSTIMETVIRLMVFEDLDLTHTCCDWNYLQPFDENEERAIHEEEEQCLSELEQLVDEFMGLYNRLNLPLLQFLQEHWCPRMQDYLQQGQPLSEEDLSKTREIGVDLSPSCPLRSDAWCVLLQPKVTETRDAGVN